MERGGEVVVRGVVERRRGRVVVVLIRGRETGREGALETGGGGGRGVVVVGRGCEVVCLGRGVVGLGLKVVGRGWYASGSVGAVGRGVGGGVVILTL